MGCHIDGFIAAVAHTHVIQEGAVTGRKADVIAAANTAAEVALRLVRPGKKVCLTLPFLLLLTLLVDHSLLLFCFLFCVTVFTCKLVMVLCWHCCRHNVQLA